MDFKAPENNTSNSTFKAFTPFPQNHTYTFQQDQFRPRSIYSTPQQCPATATPTVARSHRPRANPPRPSRVALPTHLLFIHPAQRRYNSNLGHIIFISTMVQAAKATTRANELFCLHVMIEVPPRNASHCDFMSWITTFSTNTTSTRLYLSRPSNMIA